MAAKDVSPTNAQIAEIAEDLIREARFDYVGLWQICKRVRHDFRIEDGPQVKRAVLQIVRGMMDRGADAVHQPSSGSGCLPWADQDPASVIDTISSQWEALGREPSVGDIAWFDNADSGTRV